MERTRRNRPRIGQPAPGYAICCLPGEGDGAGPLAHFTGMTLSAGVGAAPPGPAEYTYGLRARCRIWPPFRPTRLSRELGEIGAALPHKAGHWVRPTAPADL